MPSIRYINQSAPFWDFVASLENQGPSHSMPANRSAEPQGSSDEEGPQAWEWGTGHPWMGRGNHGFHRGPPPPRGLHGPHPPPPHHAGNPPPPPPPQHEGPPPPPPTEGPRPEGHQGPPHHAGHPPPPPHEQSPFGLPHHDGPPHPHHHHGHGGRRGGRRGGFGRGSWGQGGFPTGGPFNFGGLAELFQQQLFGSEQNNGEERAAAQDDFKPEADVFDTETAYIVHVSLPGAKKEDVGVSWDAEKSELSVGGVVYRPGDEELLKTLALDERKVGAFERKIRLGSRANPAQVDDDAITAKLEDGILRIEVPKLDKDYVEIKKVDIE